MCLTSSLGYHATVAAIRLDENDAAHILALPCEEVALPDIEVLHRERTIADRKSLLPSRGPAPTTGERSFTVEARDYGYVYAFRFSKRNVWKIGNSYNPDQCIEHLNCNIPYQATGERWEPYGKQRLSSPEQAYEIEQRAIQGLAQYSIGGEMFECEETIFKAAWTKIVVGFIMSEPS